MSYIYWYTNLENKMQYVGKTIDVIARDKSHRQNKKNNYFDNNLKAHSNNFELNYFECDNQCLNFMEQYCIAWYQSKIPNEYNLTDGGEGIIGYKLTEEQLQYRREINSGINNPMYGRHHTEESKRKISINQLGEKNHNYGKHLSEECKRKLREVNTGREVSEETREKMRQNHADVSGENNPQYGTGKKVLCKKTNTIYRTARDAEAKTGINHSSIYACCNGKQKTAGGSEWEYIEVDYELDYDTML